MKGEGFSRRRFLGLFPLAGALAGGAALSSCAGLGAGLEPAFLVRPEAMAARLAGLFPLRRSYRGLAEVVFSDPVLAMVPEAGKVRVGLSLAGALAGLGDFRGGRAGGRCQLACGLRYDPGTRGIFLKDSTLEDFTLSGVPAQWTEGVRQVANALGPEVLERHPVHTLAPGLGTSLLKSMRVTPQGVLLGFGL